MKRKYTREQKATRKIISEMLKENTGRHLLDSGGYSGRHWQHNAKIEFENTPEATLEIDKYGINVTLSLYHFLAERLTFAPVVQKDFDKFAAREDQQNNDWSDTMEQFVKASGGEARYSYYTYNENNMLGQDFIVSAWNDVDGNAMCFVQSHNGCDARGGFSSPKAFQFNHDCELYDYDRATIYCDNGHWWDYQPGYSGGWDSDEYDNLESFPVVQHEGTNVDADTLEMTPEPHVLAAAWREFKALADSVRLPLPFFDNVPPALPVGGKIVVNESGAHCPICGAILRAEAPIAN